MKQLLVYKLEEQQERREGERGKGGGKKKEKANPPNPFRVSLSWVGFSLVWLVRVERKSQPDPTRAYSYMHLMRTLPYLSQWVWVSRSKPIHKPLTYHSLLLRKSFFSYLEIIGDMSTLGLELSLALPYYFN